MKIVLEESDAFIQPDGCPTMVIVAVTKDDGKVIRFPYPARDKSISCLIEEINMKIGDAPSSERKYGVESFAQDTGKTVQEAAKKILELSGMNNEGKIHRECLVKCIKILPRDKHAPIDMEIGGIYRVLELPKNKIPYYEIIDDTDYHKAEIPRRIAAYPEEIEFFQKRKTPIVKELGKIEEIFNCELCKKSIVGYRMDDNKYHAKCGECKHETISDTVRQPVAQTT